MKVTLRIALLCLLVLSVSGTELWSKEKANAWYEQIGWRVGCNFIPSTAVNQLEMWQVETFDPVTIQRELGLAHGLGFNTIRVFLHYLAWGEDKEGFKQRMHTFLNITDQFNLKTSFVLFDDCWKDDPHVGEQPNPIPGVHNSQWVQCPGNAQPVYGDYQEYVHDILTEFAYDDRVIYWDLYNEPGNSQHYASRLSLLEDVFSYARQVNISQPVTAGLWYQGVELNTFQLENSDIITFHRYSTPLILEAEIKILKAHGRPVICTEYMARTIGSTFENSLPVFQKYNVGAINWGLVFGKTQTYMPWGSPKGAPIPKTWFHDVFWPNATCFSENECAFIRNITSSERVAVY